MTRLAKTSMSHLGDHARESLVLSNDQRIQRINGDRWIGYERAQKIMKKLDDLYGHPTVNRSPNLLILGSSNNGKTMIASRFLKKHPASDNPDGNGVVVPVIMVRVSEPDEDRLYTAILDKVFAPYKPSDPPKKKQSQVISTLRRIGLRMLIIDDIHDILAGHLLKQKVLLQVLRLIGNELSIPIVATGTKDAIRALQSDPQLANRFEPAPLPKWQMGEEYLRLLASFERMLPLKNPSNLIETGLATKILSMGEGLIGEVAMILRRTAIYAIESGSERIDAKALDAISWICPSDRRRVAETLV